MRQSVGRNTIIITIKEIMIIEKNKKYTKRITIKTYIIIGGVFIAVRLCYMLYEMDFVNNCLIK